VYKLIDSILTKFKPCFKREATFQTFVVLVIGMLLRKDTQGISSIVSTLRLKSKFYFNLIHFFRSKAYEIKDFKKHGLRV